MYCNTAVDRCVLGKLSWVCFATLGQFRTNSGMEGGFPLSNQTGRCQHTSKFPVGLLIAGYGTACLGALFLSTLGAGRLVTGLTFWLGGAVAVIAWGGVRAYFRTTILARSRRPAAPRLAVPANWT